MLSLPFKFNYSIKICKLFISKFNFLETQKVCLHPVGPTHLSHLLLYQREVIFSFFAPVASSTVPAVHAVLLPNVS